MTRRMFRLSGTEMSLLGAHGTNDGISVTRVGISLGTAKIPLTLYAGAAKLAATVDIPGRIAAGRPLIRASPPRPGAPPPLRPAAASSVPGSEILFSLSSSCIGRPYRCPASTTRPSGLKSASYRLDSHLRGHNKPRAGASRRR